MASLEQVATMYRHDLGSFAGFAYRELNPRTAYSDNWHIHVLAEALRKVECGEIRKLIVNMPPRSGKSLISSVAFPAWVLGRNPHRKIVCLSGGTLLGRDLHNLSAGLMTSRRYRALFGSLRPADDVRRIPTGHGGYRQFLPFEARLAGLSADIVIIDDPVDPRLVQDGTARQSLNEHFDRNILQRLDSKKTGAVVLVMQRLHPEDLTAFLLAKDDGWVHINIPAIALADETWDLPHGRSYIRKKGEVLDPAREPVAQLVDILHEIGGYNFAYQYLQGLYTPVFGSEGHGNLWLSALRVGEFYHPDKVSGRPTGFFPFTEAELILPRVFGIGEDPCPANMRSGYTPEEILWIGNNVRLDQESGEMVYPKL